MAGSRKLLAILRLALVAALFWGVAAALGGLGTRIIVAGIHLRGVSGLLLRLFELGAGIGFVGGILYATAIALAPPQAEGEGLSGTRTAVAGALAGILVFAALRLTILSGVGAGPEVTIAIPGAVFAVLGAATGLGILGTARQSRLPREKTPQQSIAP